MDSHGAEIAHSTTSPTEPSPPPSTTEHPSTLNPDDPAETASTAASSINNSVLEVDSSSASHDNSDADSAISDVRGLSSTQSANSSIYDFVEEHGRTYHKYKEGKYLLPNDGEEQNRLDLQHHLFVKLVDGRLHLAPIKTPHNVLDVGTGTGIWAIEFANQYPSASVTGSDLSPIQPEYVPPNCQFKIDDAEDEWVFSKTFDFIHWRAMMTCFSDPRSVIEQAYKQCAPGGYLELQDGVFPLHCRDDTLAGTALDSWSKRCLEAGIKIGRPWNNTVNYKRWMEEIGFEDVKEKIYEIPTNTWARGMKAKELGVWFNADLIESISASKVLFIKMLGWAPEAVEVFFIDVRNDLKNKGIHAFMPL